MKIKLALLALATLSPPPGHAARPIRRARPAGRAVRARRQRRHRRAPDRRRMGQGAGQAVFIENKAGAGGNIGVDAVAKAAPDGYTIGLQTVSLAINPSLFAKMPYDTLKDLAPIGMVASSQHVLVVNTSLPGQGHEGTAGALAKSKPGKLQLRLGRRRQHLPHVGRTVQGRRRRRHRAHPVQRRRPGAGRHHGRPGRHELSRCCRRRAARARRQAARDRRDRPEAFAAAAERADHAESGVPGYSFETWFIVFAPAGTPQADDRQAQCRAEQGARRRRS